jgi:ferrous iron transport protein B
MITKCEIILKKEYSVSKISGYWSLRREINKLGIKPYDKITFLKSCSDYYKLRLNNEKRVKKIHTRLLNNIELLNSQIPDVNSIIKKSLSNIRVDVFRSDLASESNIFNKSTEYKYGDYNFKINYLPALSSIYGDNYENKKLRNSILTNFPDIFLGIVDYQNLETDLYLVSQFIDMDAKIVLALRNYNPNSENNDKIDFDLLSKLIGIPIVFYEEPIDEENENKELLNKVLETLVKTHLEPADFVRHVHVNYGREIEAKIFKIEKYLKKRIGCNFLISPRYFAINLLEKDILSIKAHSTNFDNTLQNIANKEIQSLEKKYRQHIFSILKDARRFYVKGAITEISTVKSADSKSKKIDKILLHKIWGIPIFLLFIALTFYATFELGKYPMGWLVTGIKLLTEHLNSIMSEGFWRDLIINGAIDGVGGVLVFLPNIFILFFFIAIMENTGYLSRVAFAMDKYMHKIGLHGKSFIPLIMGFGCSIPAIMSTRILENKRDKILTMMIIPFMSCSARLPIYILMISAFFPEHPALILFIVYGFGILLALIISKLFSTTILKQKEAPYVMELMPYRKPTLRILLGYMCDRGKEYLKKIGGIILIGSIIIWLLGYFPKNVDYSKNYNELIAQTQNTEIVHKLELERDSEQHEKSYIGRIGHFIEPIMRPLGFDWKMSISVLAGIAGKEITVSTMSVLYQAKAEDGQTSYLQEKLKVEKYMSGYRAGESIFNKVVALSFIMFMLIYFPCFAVLSAIWKKASKFKWALFNAVYSISIAWLVSFSIYQIGILIV